MYVLGMTAKCDRDKMYQEHCKEVIFSLIFSFSIYDISKKVLYGWNMLNSTKTSKKKLRIVQLRQLPLKFVYFERFRPLPSSVTRQCLMI